MKKLFAFILITILMTLSFTTWSKGQEGHGGDMVAAEFYSLSGEVLKSLKLVPSSELPTKNFSKLFEQSLENTDIFSVDRVFVDNFEVDAINFPDADNPKIMIGRERWLDKRLTEKMKKMLIIHEFLSIMGFDDALYKLSSQISKLIIKFQGAN